MPNTRKEIAINALNQILEADDSNEGNIPFVDCVTVTALQSMAINIADLTDKVSELAAYMMGVTEWIKEKEKENV